MRKTLIVYFYFIIILSAIEYFMRAYVSFRIAGAHYFSIPNWIDLIFTSISLIGFYGYLYKKQILVNSFWKVFSITLVGYFFWSIFVEIKVHEQLMSTTPIVKIGWKDWIDFSFGFMIFLPAYICICIYAFRPGPIWGGHSNLS